MREHVVQLAEAFARQDWTSARREGTRVIDALAESPSTAIATAHPLGFIHLLLWERPDGSRLRLHLWPREPFELQQPAWVVHRHPWALKSLVVEGKIRDGRFSVVDEPDGQARIYEAGYVDNESVLHRTDRSVSCIAESSRLWYSGDAYDVPPDVFHASEAEAPSVTIAESGTPIGRRPLVVGASDGDRLVRYRRRQLESAELGAVLAEAWPGVSR
jgi:hypothetical protein